LKGDAGAALDLLTAAKRAQADADKAARDAAATEIEKHASTIRAALRRLEKSGDVKALAALAKVALKCSPEPAAAPV
jgi:3-methyladenine DNA glycosylase AlkC